MKKNQKKKPYKKQSKRKYTYFIGDKYFVVLIIALLLFIGNLGVLIFKKGQEKNQKRELKREIAQLERKRQKELLSKKKIKYGDIIFLGDSITNWYDLEKYYDIPIVNSGVVGWTTDDILNNLEEKVFQYDAKKIFLLIGTNDINANKDSDDIVHNIEKIVTEIKKKKKNSKIYMESIYPINNSKHEKIKQDIVGIRTNEEIKKVNQEIKKYSEKNKMPYINIYNQLIDKQGNLKLEYTKEGLHVSEDGYEVVTKILKRYI